MSKIKYNARFISNDVKTSCGYYYIKNKRYIIYEKDCGDDDAPEYYDSFVIDENGQKDYFSITSSYQQRYFPIVSYDDLFDDLLKKAKEIRRLGNKLLDRL